MVHSRSIIRSLAAGFLMFVTSGCGGNGASPGDTWEVELDSVDADDVGAAVCKPGGAGCDDGNPCTLDGCDEVLGCLHQPVGGACEDGDPCTTGEACVAGVCAGGAPVVCQRSACLAAECLPAAGGCVSAPVADGTPCDDGDLCTMADACVGGDCAPGPPVDCDSGDPCLMGACDSDSGCAFVPGEDGVPCDDGETCTTADSCLGGHCVGEPLDCDDGDACTVDACASNGDCTHEPKVTCSAFESCDPGLGACVAAMVPVPEGPFWMGCALADQICDDDEEPLHEVWLSAYEIDRVEVTTAAFIGFLEAHGNNCGPAMCAAVDPGWGTWPHLVHTETSSIARPGWETHPMTVVTWYGAVEYCAWLGKSLCTEAQWEKAARGGCELYPAQDCASAMPIYPWGDAMATCEYAVMPDPFSTPSGACGLGGSSGGMPVGSKPAGASPYGILDLAGNAAEWVADYYDAAYYQESPSADPLGPDFGSSAKGVRGGDMMGGWGTVRASRRWAESPNNFNLYLGFRCCRAAP